MHHAVSFHRILLIVLPVLSSNFLFSQVTIKEKIPISPTAPMLIRSSAPVGGHTLRFEGVWDVPIFARMYTSHCYGRFDTGTGSMTFEIPLTAGGYTFDFQPRVAELQPHQVCNVTLTVKLDGQVVMQQSASFVGGSLAVFALWPGDYPSYGSPYNTTFAFSVGDSMLYEEGVLPNIAGVSTCDEGLWDPTSTLDLQIVGGAAYAQFYDYNTRLPQGTSINGTVQHIQDNYELVADGTVPDSSGTVVTVQATSGGITQTASVKIKPYFFRVAVDSPHVSYGSGTAIRIQTVEADGKQYYRAVIPLVRVRITDSLDYGALWYGYSDSSRVLQMADTLTDIPSFFTADPFSGVETRFYAIEQQPKDSVAIHIAVEKTGEGPMIDYAPPNAQPFQGKDMVRGTTQVTVVVAVTKQLKIVDHSPWEIWPHMPPQISSKGDTSSRGADRPGYNPKHTFSILVQDGSGQPLPNEEVGIFTKYEEGSGGHGHGGFADTGGTIPALKAMPDNLQGLFYKGGVGKNPLIFTTDEKGIALVDSFRASQGSGKFLITARLISDTTIMDTVNLQVKVPGLVDFGTGDYWNLTGTTSRMGRNHLSNHWCTQKTKDSLSAVLKTFYDWSASEKGGGTAIKIGVNDMAIEWGGAFDIPGTWIFKEEHSFHRIGVSVDIDQNPGNLRKKDGTLNPSGERLKEIMDTYGGKKYKEPSIHFGFDNGI